MKFLLPIFVTLLMITSPAMAVVSGGGHVEIVLRDASLNGNSLNDTTPSIEMGEDMYVSVYVKSASGSHSTHVLTLQTSPDGTDWYDTSSTITGTGVLGNILCVTGEVRIKVTTIEGVASLIDVIMLVK